MTPRIRFLKTLRGEKPDRVPLVLERFAVRSGDEIDRMDDPARREIARRVLPHVTFPVACFTQSNRYLMTDPRHFRKVSEERKNGTTVTTTAIDTPKGTLTAITGRSPDIDTVWTVKYPVESLTDVEKIRSAPWQLSPDVKPPDLADLPAEFDGRGYVRSGVSSPFVCVAGMMPYEYFLELCATELDLLRELTELCLQRALANLDAVLADKTIEYVWMGGCEWLTPPMGSPPLYEELVQNFERPVIERIHQGGAIAHVHCHGRVRSTLELAAQRGADFFEPVEPPPDGDIPFADAKHLAAGRMTLGGNLEARILECGTVDEVDHAVRAAFDGGKERMILQTTAGPIGRMSPRTVANYHRMIDLWEELSAI